MALSNEDKRAIQIAGEYKTLVNEAFDLCLRQTKHEGSRVACGHASFSLGVLKTVSAGDALAALWKHATCKWGDLSPKESERNTFAMQNGGPLLSVQKTTRGERIVIFTRSDRSATLVLLPQECKRAGADYSRFHRASKVIDDNQVRRQLYRFDFVAEQRDRAKALRPHVQISLAKD